MKPVLLRTLLAGSLVGAAVLPAIAIPLPDASSTASASTALSITNTGTGGAGAFQINNAANASYALQGLSNGSGISIYGYMTGTGRAGYFQISNPANNAYALTAVSNGTGISQYNLMSGLGRALYVQTSNAANANNTFTAITNGKGSAALYQITNVTNTAPTLSAMTNGSGSAVQGLNTGTGRAGLFQLNNTTSTSHGVEATSNGLDYTVYSLNTGYGEDPNKQPINGGAGWFEIVRPENTADALVGKTNGLGYAVMGLNTGYMAGAGEKEYSGGAGWFEIDRKENVAPALVVKTNGKNHAATIDITESSAGGDGLLIRNQGGGKGIAAEVASQYSAAGYFTTYNSLNSGPTLHVFQQGVGDGIYAFTPVYNNANAIHAYHVGNGNAILGEAPANLGSANAIKGVVGGSGYAGYFEGTGAASKGVYVSVPAANPGLNVVSGTKTAIVPTSSGARALYTEESSETWFTDYGFGKLEKGQATVEIDPTFAETVNLDQPYHVFLQAYDRLSTLVVTNRTKTGFTVKGEPDVEFSYRLVAKRRGHESKRLERTPFADNDPNLLESKRQQDLAKQEAK